MLVALACGAPGCGDNESPEPELRVRKNVKDLTVLEKQDLVDAILLLKQTPAPPGFEPIVINTEITIDMPSYYDVFVAFHQAAVMESVHNQGGQGVAHKNASFPPWHRKLLLMYENALRDVSGKDIALPYWDWTDQASTDAVFAVDFMGPAGDPDCQPDCPYAVVEGPFRKGEWELNLLTLMDSYVPVSPWNWLVRATGRYDGLSYPVALPSVAEIDAAMNINTYDVAPYDNTVDRTLSFRNYLEGFDPPTNNQYMHNIGHDWVAGVWAELDANGDPVLDPEGKPVIAGVGTMEPLDISPSDPVFFLHHCNVDRVWAQWQMYEDGRLDDYVPDSGAPQGWNLNDDMYPYILFTDVPQVGLDITPASMLRFEPLGYTYSEFVP